MTKFIYILPLFLLLLFRLEAQQLPTFNMFGENAFIINPGILGFDRLTALTANYNYKWTGMPESPYTTTVSFRRYFEQQKMAAGAYLFADVYGPSSFVGLCGAYAYHVKLNAPTNPINHRLSLGISLSAMWYRLRGDKLLFNDANDPTAIRATASTILPDAGLGAFYYSNIMYMGISAAQIIPLNARFTADAQTAAVRRIPHFYFNGGYKHLFSKEDRYYKSKETKLISSIWVDYALGSKVVVRANSRYVWNKILAGGLGFSSNGEIMADCYVIVADKLRIGYAFSMGLTNVGIQLGTSHEIMCGFVFEGRDHNWFFPNLNVE